MANGISGSSPAPVAVVGQYTQNELLVELRTLSVLIQTHMGTNTTGVEELATLRSDQAFALGLPVPYPPNQS